MVALFTNDCERVIAGTLDQVVTGREALLQACLATTPIRRSDDHYGESVSHTELAETEIRHYLTTETIKFAASGQTAWVVAYYQIVGTRGEGESFIRGSHEGTYHIELVRDPGAGWLMKRQVIWTNHATNPLFKAHS